jgi:hypothetical protein
MRPKGRKGNEMNKKLKLNRETLSVLGEQHVREIDGGTIIFITPSFWCTQYGFSCQAAICYGAVLRPMTINQDPDPSPWVPSNQAAPAAHS